MALTIANAWQEVLDLALQFAQNVAGEYHSLSNAKIVVCIH